MKQYSEKLKDYYHNPRNCGKLSGITNIAEQINVTCGDQIKLYLNVKQNKICDIRHETSGCMICVASASAVSEFLIGKNISVIKRLDIHDIEKLFNIKVSPARIPCATLVISALLKI